MNKIKNMLILIIFFIKLSYRNLMKRAENCVDCKINHIRFEHAALVFEFAKSKSLQDGEDHVGLWHCYANPYSPDTCVVLAMARYLFYYPDVMSGRSPLFEGTSQYNRYANIFRALLTKNETELKRLGVKEGDLGTHSLRKGVATLVTAASTVSPPIISICTRAGWTMGGVKDKYLRFVATGDQYVGRCASLLNQNGRLLQFHLPTLITLL